MRRILVLAHREELIFQAARKVRDVLREEPEIEMANLWANGSARVVISTIQTQIAGENGNGRMSRFRPHEFGLLVVDEAHHCPATSYRRVLQWYQRNPDLRILGVTATPDRHDEKALGRIFDSVAYEYTLPDAIADGWLVAPRQRSVTVRGLDFSRCRTTAGDLNGKDLAQVMEAEEALHGIAHPTYEIADGRKTLLFAASVAHAERLCEIFNRHEPDCARFVYAGTPTEERRQLFRDYAAGNFQFLTNVGVATEGFDEPGIQVVAVARPTKSRALYAQMLGRGTRPLPGLVDGLAADTLRRQAIADSDKPFLEVIDFVGNAGRHKLISTVDILGGNYDNEVVDQARRAVETKEREGVPADVGAELERAKAALHAARQAERERRRNVIGVADYHSRFHDPFDVLDIEPERERGYFHGKAITEKMAGVLRRNGFDPDKLSFTHARQVVREIIEHPEKLPATPKQRALLQRYGYRPDVSKAKAGEIIDAIAANGWRRPRRKPSG